MKKIVVFTGAGVSADSGIATFRDSDGLWANYRIEDVCTPEALATNRPTVIEFYNIRRRELLQKRANPAHTAIASLESKYQVEVITQNIDDLHERAGSTRITHLHGELSKLRSMKDPDRIYAIPGWQEAARAVENGADVDDYASVWKEETEAKDEHGDLLRPHVVFFGESVPNYDPACRIASTADILIVCGTSLAVYPAAALVFAVRKDIPVYLVDPGSPDTSHIANPVHFIQKKAAEGMPELCRRLLSEAD
ncbi:MAG: NAD-dependent deacylase [Bacteroides sp.]|nr:NAD-dependent deacylase [Bacteroides sp.]MCM1084832.1 NAD-dependent deacylase [Bacteroides sp.]